jgi:hypothetical protein
MKIPLLPTVAVAVLALGAGPVLAQEKREEVRPTEKTTELPPPKKLPQPSLPLAAPDCEPPHPSLNVLWLERQEPIHVLVPRVEVKEVTRPTLKIVYRDEKRVVTDIVIKSREVLREVPHTVMVPCTETDPHTGHCTTILKPVVETTLRKDVEYYAVPEEHEVTVKVPYVGEGEETVVRKSILLECKTELQKHGYAVAVPGPEVLHDRWLMAPCCAAHPPLPADLVLPPVGAPVRPPREGTRVQLPAEPIPVAPGGP